jgi:phosphoglycerate kinase
VAEKFEAHAAHRTVEADGVPEGMMALDVGPRTVAAIGARLRAASTLVWNGPLGAFEIAPFDRATVEVAELAASLTASGALKSIGGGGDTVSALRHAGVADRLTYLSTAGGAFLEWLEGKALPGVEALSAAQA